MNEGQVTVDAHSYELPQPFLVIATQNPVEHHGTYPLPESQLDRFLMRVRMGYPDATAEREILRSEAGAERLPDLRPVLNGADVLEMQEAVKHIRVDESLVSYALEIVKRTRESEYLSLGVSPRGAQALYRSAQAMAFLDGRGFSTPQDFKSLAVPVFAHRVLMNGGYASSYGSSAKKSEQGDQVLKEIVESVSVPV
jgi:MoxR-like ATPase